MENLGICIPWPLGIYYGHLVYFVAIGQISGTLVYSRFDIVCQDLVTPYKT
jgi:hypothetical protein